MHFVAETTSKRSKRDTCAHIFDIPSEARAQRLRDWELKGLWVGEGESEEGNQLGDAILKLALEKRFT